MARVSQARGFKGVETEAQRLAIFLTSTLFLELVVKKLSHRRGIGIVWTFHYSMTNI
jgi:hypothetical protein